MLQNGMKPNSNFKRASRRIILPEILGPLIVIFLSGLFVAAWGLVLQTTEDELLGSLRSAEPYVIIPVTASIFSLVDFILAFFLLIGVHQLNITICILWILLQLFLLTTFSLSLFLCPFVSLNVISEPFTLGWVIGGTVLVLLYKLYRFRFVYFLIEEIQEERTIWEGRSRIYSLYNYE